VAAANHVTLEDAAMRGGPAKFGLSRWDNDARVTFGTCSGGLAALISVKQRRLSMYFQLGCENTFEDHITVNTKVAVILLLLLLGFVPGGLAVVDDAHTYALEVGEPYVKKGFTVREEHWAGSLARNEKSSIAAQLFKGNEYWFWLASDEKDARVTIHIYDSSGKLVDAEAWQKGKTAAVRVLPKSTGTYFIVFSVTETKLDRTRWAVAYGFR
jgi:hypothetical protein